MWIKINLFLSKTKLFVRPFIYRTFIVFFWHRIQLIPTLKSIWKKNHETYKAVVGGTIDDLFIYPKNIILDLFCLICWVYPIPGCKNSAVHSNVLSYYLLTVASLTSREGRGIKIF